MGEPRIGLASFMHKLLGKDTRRVKRDPKLIPNEGMLRPINVYDTRRGWHYQIDCVKDSRMSTHPLVVVYAFAPPSSVSARAADFWVSREL